MKVEINTNNWNPITIVLDDIIEYERMMNIMLWAANASILDRDREFSTCLYKKLADVRFNNEDVK